MLGSLFVADFPWQWLLPASLCGHVCLPYVCICSFHASNELHVGSHHQMDDEGNIRQYQKIPQKCYSMCSTTLLTTFLERVLCSNADGRRTMLFWTLGGFVMALWCWRWNRSGAVITNRLLWGKQMDTTLSNKTSLSGLNIPFNTACAWKSVLLSADMLLSLTYKQRHVQSMGDSGNSNRATEDLIVLVCLLMSTQNGTNSTAGGREWLKTRVGNSYP